MKNCMLISTHHHAPIVFPCSTSKTIRTCNDKQVLSLTFLPSKHTLPLIASFQKSLSSPPPSYCFSSLASTLLTSQFVKTIVDEIFFSELKNFLLSSLENLSHQISNQLTIVVEEKSSNGYSRNQIFDALQLYLGFKISSSNRKIRVCKEKENKRLAISVDKDEIIFDSYQGIEIKWRLFIKTSESKNTSNKDSPIRSYVLCFNKKNRDEILNSYLPYVLAKAKAIREETKKLNLYTIGYYNSWDCGKHDFPHPMTFETLAMDSKVKKDLMDDLNEFVNRKQFYKRIGKAWKRGYLLYGPPGTGKSSLIAAMANYLHYDIYDLDLTQINSNQHLKMLLTSMSNRSILVIEDIDCSAKLHNRDAEDHAPYDDKTKMTLSGLLNFVDGLWSCCIEEHIIIFTTNHKNKLDPALLRPGRMDVHILLSYCNSSTFEQLAFNYLQIHHHTHFEPIKELIEKIKVTPAEVAGELMKSSDPELSLQGLVQFLHNKEDGISIKNREENKGKTEKKKKRK